MIGCLAQILLYSASLGQALNNLPLLISSEYFSSLTQQSKLAKHRQNPIRSSLSLYPLFVCLFVFPPQGQRRDVKGCTSLVRLICLCSVKGSPFANTLLQNRRYFYLRFPWKIIPRETAQRCRQRPSWCCRRELALGQAKEIEGKPAFSFCVAHNSEADGKSLRLMWMVEGCEFTGSGPISVQGVGDAV